MVDFVLQRSFLEAFVIGGIAITVIGIYWRIILIGGAMGKVGLAAAAIAKVYGARVIGIKRKNTTAVPGHACDVLFDLEDPELAAKLMAETQQKGFPLFYNTVGSPYLALSLDVLAHKGKQILISTLARDCPFDIFKFFRKEYTWRWIIAF
jgi:NADPH:quinone reductase-like Zn-dependent oxidoreductase